MRVGPFRWCCAALLVQCVSAVSRPPLRAFRPARSARHAPVRSGVLEDFIEEATPASKISELPVMFGDKPDGKFDFERWELHRSSSRYSRLLFGILFGTTSRRILPTVAALVIFSCAVDFYDEMRLLGDPMVGFYPELQLPLTPFELTAPVLGLLLVFRTDAAYQRFNCGSEISWEITSSTRSVVRRLTAWTGTEACRNSGEQEAAMELVECCCLVHAWIMGSYLRGQQGRPAGEAGEADEGGGAGASELSDVELQALLLRMALGVSPNEGAATELDSMGAQPTITPYLALTAISLGATRRLPSLTDQERIAVDDGLASVTTALGKSEGLLRTPIPLGYTRSSVSAAASESNRFGTRRGRLAPRTHRIDLTRVHPSLHPGALPLDLAHAAAIRAHAHLQRFRHQHLVGRQAAASAGPRDAVHRLHLPLHRGHCGADRGALCDPPAAASPKVARVGRRANQTAGAVELARGCARE